MICDHANTGDTTPIDDTEYECPTGNYCKNTDDYECSSEYPEGKQTEKV